MANVTDAYHPDFWIAIAAASPVIALGYIVAITVTLRVAFQLVRADAAEVKDAKEILKRTGERKVTMTFPRGLTFSGMTALTVAGVSAALVAFDSALNSLASERDTTTPHTAVGEMFESVLVLLLLTAIISIGELFLRTGTGQKILRSLHIKA